MTTEQIVRAVKKMQSQADLQAILCAADGRYKLLIEQEREATFQPAWERAKVWPVGTTVYTTRDLIRYGDEKFSIRRGERLIVRDVMTRARAIWFERPERPEPYWKKYWHRLEASDLHYFDCQLEPPIGEAATYKG